MRYPAGSGTYTTLSPRQALTAVPQTKSYAEYGTAGMAAMCNGFGGLPICIAKTQYSLSDDDEALNSPKDFALTVTDVSLRAGAGFVVALCGDIMTMPGLPRVPAAEKIGVGEDGEITGIVG